ncbi:hypothetical protein LZZ85_12325 [Terrimonas sp. NA20]|uniref:Erythromycin esterase family protein n=1 Tax=Terrimonas ginsenosidimutans TaxID=2908004 RepID=A0ABS9KRW9_9BACT|nr:hypothetical protein [Terrimonas ginsenosidimutans]MCG2615076.1 hypothetical protein [Terrimonas ginsenosidimutans]
MCSIKKLFIFFTLFVFISGISAQSKIADCLREELMTSTPQQLNKLTDQLVLSLPGKRFYLVGESHTFLANNDLQLELLRSLHGQGVYNVACELPHATCFLYNQFLETGDEQILADLRPAATYKLLKKVREFNLSLPKEQQIRYYGIDYSDPQHGLRNLYKSLRSIRSYVTSKSLPLDTLIGHYLSKDSISMSDARLLCPQLNESLRSEEERYRSHFGIFYDDLLLMSSNMLGYKANRDNSIFMGFTLLYRLLEKRQQTAPKFLAFYGIGHMVDLGGMLEENDGSPVKGGVVKIGIQYVNCWGGWTVPSLQTTGLYKMDKKELAQLIAYCEAQPWQAALLAGKNCLSAKRGTSLDAVFIFNRYGDRKMNSWKFD